MFVSSYNTYLTQKPSTKIEENTQKKATKGFLTQKQPFATQLQKEVSASIKIPINYISNYKSLYNQQLLQQQNSLNKEYLKTKFSKINKMTKAENAYNENLQLFSLLQKPKIALVAEPRISKKLEQNNAIKQKFINTYIANDNYYKITAA